MLSNEEADPPSRLPVAALHIRAARRDDPIVDGGLTLRRNLKASAVDGIFYNLMVGMGETYLSAFVLAIGMGQVISGLVTTLPMMAGGLLQLVSPWAVARFGSRKRWVVFCAVCQAFCFLPLALGAYAGNLPIALLFGVVSLYWATNLATGPAWNSWVESLVPPRIRTTYFACRSRLCQIGVLFGFIVGGCALQWGIRRHLVLVVFACLFGTALACRLVSAAMLFSQSESRPPRASLQPMLGASLRRVLSGPTARLLVGLLAIQGSVNIAGPFFSGYMFVHLRLSYTEYMILVSTAYAAKAIALSLLGHLMRRYGAGKLLWFGSLGIVPLPLMWLVSSNFWFLLGVQFSGGIAWAAYELAMFLLLFDEIPQRDRTEILTAYNGVHAVATAGGSLVGAFVLRSGAASLTSYEALFAISGIGRLVAVAILYGTIRRYAKSDDEVFSPISHASFAERRISAAPSSDSAQAS